MNDVKKFISKNAQIVVAKQITSKEDFDGFSDICCNREKRCDYEHDGYCDDTIYDDDGEVVQENCMDSCPYKRRIGYVRTNSPFSINNIVTYADIGDYIVVVSFAPFVTNQMYRMVVKKELFEEYYAPYCETDKDQ